MFLFLTFSRASYAPLSETCLRDLNRLMPGFDLDAAKRRALDVERREGRGMVLLVPPSVGRHFDAHGLSKGSSSNHLDGLLDLLTAGIDPKKDFHSGPLSGAQGTPISPFTAGSSFVVLSAPGKSLKDGIAYVVVADSYLHMLPQLSKAFPKVHFVKSGEAAQVLTNAAVDAKLTAPEENAPSSPQVWTPSAPYQDFLPPAGSPTGGLPPPPKNPMVVP